MEERGEKVGVKILVFDVYSSGLCEVRHHRFTKIKSRPKTLKSALEGSALNYDDLIAELIRIGVVVDDTKNDLLVWPGQAVTICVFFDLIKPFLKDVKDANQFFELFKGTFYSPRVRQSRSLRKRPVTQFYTRKAKRFRELIEDIFSVSGRGKNSDVDLTIETKHTQDNEEK